MIKSILNLRMFSGVFSQVAVSWDMCKALFQCWLELFKITLWGVFGRSREVRKSLLEASGGVTEAAKRLQKALREGKRRPRASKTQSGATKCGPRGVQVLPKMCPRGAQESSS